MKFLIDNSLSPRLAVALCADGHDAIHIREIGLASASDDRIFELAAEQDRIIIAQDTDFGTILALRSEHRPSLVLFRTRLKSVETMLPLLKLNLPAVKEDLLNGAVVVFEDTRIRVRSLPINE